MNDNKLIGASIEINGGQVYDPLGLLELHKIAPSNLPHSKWLRESEIKHCRIAMLAVIGAFTGKLGLVIPGYTAIEDPVLNLNKYISEFPVGFIQIIAALAIIEGHFYPGEFWFGKGTREAGDLGFDPLGFYKNKTKAQKDNLQLQELKNGRLALIALSGFTSEHWIHGSTPFGLEL